MVLAVVRRQTFGQQFIEGFICGLLPEIHLKQFVADLLGKLIEQLFIAPFVILIFFCMILFLLKVINKEIIRLRIKPDNFMNRHIVYFILISSMV